MVLFNISFSPIFLVNWQLDLTSLIKFRFDWFLPDCFIEGIIFFMRYVMSVCIFVMFCNHRVGILIQ